MIMYVASKVEKIERPTKDLCIIGLSLEKPMPFIAGQFIGIVRTEGNRIIKKSYSIASSPSDPSRIELAVKRLDNGRTSTFLYNLKQGDRVVVEGPYGIFTLNYPLKRDAVFIATGTGIAPIRSMIRNLFERGTDRKVTLVYGVRHEEDLLYRQEFEKLERKHDNFRFIPVLSKPNEKWKGATGRVQQNALPLLDKEKVEVYVCGALPMVQETKALLASLGFEREFVKMERFV